MAVRILREGGETWYDKYVSGRRDGTFTRVELDTTPYTGSSSERLNSSH